MQVHVTWRDTGNALLNQWESLGAQAMSDIQHNKYMTRKKYAVCNVKYPVKDTLPIKYLNLNYVLSKQIGSAGICYD